MSVPAWSWGRTSTVSKRFEIVTPRLELRLTYLTGLLEPVSEEARMLYAALSHLHEAVPMDTLTFQVSTEEGTYAFRAVSLAGSSRSEEHTSELQSQSNLGCR